MAAAIRVNLLITNLRSTSSSLEQSDRHKSIFLANMSHELRTPLNAILGFSQVLLDDPESKIPSPTRTNFLSRINTSGQHLLALINDILDLSKVEAGQMELHLEPTSVSAIVELVLSTIQPLADQKQISLTSSVPPALSLQADPNKLRQMLLNLISNSIKFTPALGRVTVTAQQKDSTIEIAVTDTGIGLSPSDLELLFQEFHQIDSGPDRTQEGTGLGLALTRRFAALHGGTITVTSTKGLGSTFTLHLPLVPPQTVPTPLPVSTSDPSLPLVLVVEDNPAASELLAFHLAAGGFRVEFARDGHQALQKASSLHPLAITLDILLPGIDGWEVLRLLKADPITASIPVIVVSVVDNASLARALGATDFLVKPISKQVLLAALAHHLRTASSPRVLLIDDEAEQLDLLEAILTPASFVTLRALGGAEGIALARSSSPDLVLLDLRMPVVSGFDVVEALRSDPLTRHLPIIILTSKQLTDADRTALQGRVAAVFERHSLNNAELVLFLHQIVSQEAS